MFKENRLVFQQPGAGGEVPHASELEEGVKAPETGEQQQEGEKVTGEVGQEKAEEFVKLTGEALSRQLQPIIEEILVPLKNPEADKLFQAMLPKLNDIILKATGYQIVSFSYSKGKDSCDVASLPEAQIQELAKKFPGEMQKMKDSLSLQAVMFITDARKPLAEMREKQFLAKIDADLEEASKLK